MNYFIGDPHIGHENILKYDKRPFSSIKEHDLEFMKRWNSVVTDEDDVYILGDVSWLDEDGTIEYYKKLKGKKHLIKGNHDGKILKNPEFRKLFVEITDYKELFLTKKFGIILSHYPIPCFNKHLRGWIHFYAHVHNTFEWDVMLKTKEIFEKEYGKKCDMYNVGCMMDYINYTPRTLEEILSSNTNP